MSYDGEDELLCIGIFVCLAYLANYIDDSILERQDKCNEKAKPVKTKRLF